LTYGIEYIKFRSFYRFKGLFDFFTGKLEVVIKFDHETEHHLERKTKELNLSKQTDTSSTPHLGSEHSGQLAFNPEMLTLREDSTNERWKAEKHLEAVKSLTLFPIYRDGEDIKGTVRRSLNQNGLANYLLAAGIRKTTSRCRFNWSFWCENRVFGPSHLSQCLASKCNVLQFAIATRGRRQI
jgi:hypothetical protein